MSFNIIVPSISELTRNYPDYTPVQSDSSEGKKLYDDAFQEVDARFTGHTFKLVGRMEASLTCGEWVQKCLSLVLVILTLGLILISTEARAFVCKTKNETLLFLKNQITVSPNPSSQAEPTKPILQKNEPLAISSGPAILPPPPVLPVLIVQPIPKPAPETTLPPSEPPIIATPVAVAPTASVIALQSSPPPLPPGISVRPSITELIFSQDHLLNKGLSLRNIVEAHPFPGQTADLMSYRLDNWTVNMPFQNILFSEIFHWLHGLTPSEFIDWQNQDTKFDFPFDHEEYGKYALEIRKKFFAEIKLRIQLLEKEVELSKRLRSHPLRDKLKLSILCEPWSRLRLILVDNLEFQKLKVSDVPIDDEPRPYAFFRDYIEDRIASSIKRTPSIFPNINETLLIDLPHFSAAFINDRQGSANKEEHLPNFVLTVVSPSEIPNIQLEHLSERQLTLLLDRPEGFKALKPEQLKAVFNKVHRMCCEWLSPEQFLELIRDPDSRAKITKDTFIWVKKPCWEAITLSDLQLIADRVPNWGWERIPPNLIVQFFDPTKMTQVLFQAMFPNDERTKVLFAQIGRSKLDLCKSYFVSHHLEKLPKAS